MRTRHFRLHWSTGEVRDFYSETITEIFYALLLIGEFAGLERFEEVGE